MIKTLASHLTAIVFVALIPITAHAQTCPGSPGCLDPTFGNGGTVFTQINVGTNNWANGVAVQPFDGKLVVTAESNSNPYILRYDTNGTLDPSFGIGGVVSAPAGEGIGKVAIQSDGQIILVGNAPLTPGSSVLGFTVARLNMDGSYDSSFGVGGKVLFNFANNVSAIARDVVVQSNGNIVIVGLSSYDFAVARLTRTGAFDTTFNGSGRTTVQTSNFADLGPYTGGAIAVAIQPADGKIVAVGHRPPVQKSGRDFAVIRFNYNGTLDSSFGTKGQVYTDFYKYNDEISGVAIDSSNRIVVAGRANTGTAADLSTYRFALARYLSNGQLDSTFGSGGKVIAGVSGQFNSLRDVSIQGDGKLIVSGKVGPPSNPVWAAARFNVNGSSDASYGFNGSGIVLTDFPDGDEATSDSVLLSDGRFVLAGYAGGLSKIALARYLP